MQLILNVNDGELHYIFDRCCELGLSVEDYFHILICHDRKENERHDEADD